MNRDSKYITFLILLISSIGYLSIDLYLPSLPAISRFFSIQSHQAQLTLSVFLVSFTFSQLFYGPLSDRYGRKPILIIGFSIYIIASILCIFATTFNLLLLGRFIQGIGIGSGAVLSRSMLRDKFSGNELAKMASFLNMGVCIATTVSPAVGGLLQQTFSYKANFYGMIFLGIFAFLLLLFSQETNTNKIKTSAFISHCIDGYLNVVKKKNFLLNVFCAGLALSALITYSVANPFIFQNSLGLSASTYGVLALMIAFSEVIGSFISGYIVSRIGTHKLLLFGFVIMLMMSLIMIIVGRLGQMSLLSILLPTIGVGIGIGIVLPNASARAFSIFNAGIGIVGAMYGFLQLLVTTGSSFIATIFGIYTPVSIGCFIIIAGMVGLLFCKFMNPTAEPQ